MRGGDEGGATVSNPPITSPNQGAEPGNQPTPGIAVEPGVVPELKEQNLLAAMIALNQAGIQTFVVQVEREDVEPGIVFSQSPTAGSPVEDDTIVTLMAGR
jgi:hypothetical protein